MPRFDLDRVRAAAVGDLGQAVGRVRARGRRVARNNRSDTADRRCRGTRRRNTCRRSPADRTRFRRPETRRAASCARRRRCAPVARRPARRMRQAIGRDARGGDEQRFRDRSSRHREEATQAARRRRRAARRSPRSTSGRSLRLRARTRCPARGRASLRRRAGGRSACCPRTPSMRKNAYIAPAGDATSTPSSSPQRADQPVARAAQPLARGARRRLAVAQRGDAGALDEHRRARRVVFDQLADLRHQRVGRDDPAEPPAGHQPRLREAVRADDACVAVGEVEERRRARPRAAEVKRARRRRRR